jgi:putative membrane-bound dehydrogenase-like protein
MLRTLLFYFLFGSLVMGAETPGGILPLGKDGKPLNLDFETGTLKDWTLEGKAFVGQPIQGDMVAARRPDMKSNHQGKYWIGGFELKMDPPQGTLTSVPFEVTHPWGSFLVGGGPHATTAVEIVLADTKQVIAKYSGNETENMERVVVDLSKHLKKSIFIRVVDRHSGHWGHINFDDFRFHGDKPNITQRVVAATPDTYAFSGLKPEEAAKAMTVPKGFSVKLFAGEPDVKQPVAFCLDDRGRLWVAEAYSYPLRQPVGQGKDRIVIFEDVDGDGKFDKRTVFMEGLNLVSGLAYGFGGIWVGAAPELLFIPIKPGTDSPAGAPQVLLDGWGWQDTHETLNTFTWGPDGWLYGCHGVFTHSRVGKPGTPDEKRVPINAGIWRYHPVRHQFEVFAEGTSNPWGLDFDMHGQAFIEACVIPHNWHIIQGARYQRQAGQHFNPHTYDDIKTIANHRHYVGATPHSGNNRSDSAGGGHAHCGAMIYQGGTWPKEYHGKMFMGNIHGHRLNIDQLSVKGSGYQADKHPDFLLSNDTHALFINLLTGPDGNVYLIDWYDRQSCHTMNSAIWDRTSGRIYKIVHENAKPAVGIDLATKSDLELAAYQAHANEWYVRHSRRILQERAAKGPISKEVISKLIDVAADSSPAVSLRGIWALHAIGGLTPEFLVQVLKSPNPWLRGWGIQLGMENPEKNLIKLNDLVSLLESETSPIVRRYGVSATLRVSASARLELMAALLTHPEDATDPNLPYLYWYAIEAIATSQPQVAMQLAITSRIPMLAQFMARRLAAIGTPGSVEIVLDAIQAQTDANQRLAMLRTFAQGLAGQKGKSIPKPWEKLYPELVASSLPELRSLANSLAVFWGDQRAITLLRNQLKNEKATRDDRMAALNGLLSVRDAELPAVLRDLLQQPDYRASALRALAGYDDPKTPQAILEIFSKLNSTEKTDALNTLASRVAYARVLVEAMEGGKIPTTEVSAAIVRDLGNLNDAYLQAKLNKVWGKVRVTPVERRQKINEWRTVLTAKGPPNDLAMGRAIFTKVCQQCHTMYGIGGKVGPDITGANRSNLDYLLENILDSSAVIPKEYAASKIVLATGRTVTGIIRSETDRVLTVQTANEVLTIPTSEVELRETSDLSMMPDDLLKPFSRSEVAALFAYLQNPTQTPLRLTADTAKNFFSGQDLSGWDGDLKLWSVENGEIVGKSPGLKRNEFLRSQVIASNFRLSLKVKLTPNKENSGIQFRSEFLPDGEAKGPQADIGAGWWGKLYEEHGRGLLWDKSAEAAVKIDDWNEYVIEANGSKVQTWINGKLAVDLDDPKLAKQGQFALQLHSGGPFEVRFKELKLELLEK